MHDILLSATPDQGHKKILDSSSSAYLICLGGGGGLPRRRVMSKSKPPTGILQHCMKGIAAL
jgi:hypothetical protein